MYTDFSHYRLATLLPTIRNVADDGLATTGAASVSYSVFSPIWRRASIANRINTANIFELVLRFVRQYFALIRGIRHSLFSISVRLTFTFGGKIRLQLLLRRRAKDIFLVRVQLKSDTAGAAYVFVFNRFKNKRIRRYFLVAAGY